MSTKNKKAFTLVELLVVISIIALLVSILMPALSNARRQAKNVICQTNLKQWALIFLLYTDDNDDRFGEGYSWDGSPTNYDGIWHNAARKYYDNVDEIRLCPIASIPRIADNGNQTGKFDQYSAWGKFGAVFAGDYGSYGVNGWIADNEVPPGASATPLFWRQSTQGNPNNIPLVADCYWEMAIPMDFNDPPLWPIYGGDYDDWYAVGFDAGMTRFCIDRHKMAINSAFMDWSVRRVPLKELWSLKWHRKFDLGNEKTLPGYVWPDWMN